MVGQAEAIDAEAVEDAFCTGLVPVVGQGLVFNWVKFEAPVNGLIGPGLGCCGGCGWAPWPEALPQLAAAQLGENPRF